MSAPPQSEVSHLWPKAFTASKKPLEAREVCSDREAILRVLEDCPGELAQLRATLLQEHVWRQREGSR